MHHSNGIILYSALFFFSGDLTPEQVLMDYLKSNTRNIGRPINNVTKAINVTLDLTPIQLVNFVSRNPIIFCRLLSLLSTADTWCFFVVMMLVMVVIMMMMMMTIISFAAWCCLCPFLATNWVLVVGHLLISDL